MKGFIFRCNEKTKDEVFKRTLFGEEKMYLPIVKSIQTDDMLFLFDLTTYGFSGPYKPTSMGAEGIEASAWKAAFPAQIRFEITAETKTVPFRLIEKIIKKYHKGMYPDMVLDEEQVGKVLKVLIQQYI